MEDGQAIADFADPNSSSLNTKSLALENYVHCFCNEAFVDDHSPRYTCLGSLRTSQDHVLPIGV